MDTKHVILVMSHTLIKYSMDSKMTIWSKYIDLQIYQSESTETLQTKSE